MKVEDEANANSKATTSSKIMGFAHCVLLVLAIDMGGLASSLWQHFLMCGLRAGMIIFFTVSLGSFVLLLCLSELVGIVPFAGGNFGFVRCSLGPFWGFMAACLEFLYYNFYNTRSFLKLGMLVEAAHDFNPELQPLWAFVGMVFILGVNLRSGLLFWGLMMATALFTLAIVVVFWAGSYKSIDLYGYGYARKFAPQFHNDGYIGDGTRYMKFSYRAMVFYLGLELLPLCSRRVKDESTVIPKALMTSFGIIFVIAILSTFAVALSYPGISPQLNNTKFILQYGLNSATHMNPKIIPLLLIPPTITTMVGYLYAAGNQLAAMAESGLMPKYLRPRVGPDEVPMVAMVTCALIQFISYWLIREFKPTAILFATNIWSIAAPLMYVMICAAFIAFRVKFGGMKRNFVSPLGIPGAVYGIVLWLYIYIANTNYHYVGHLDAIEAFYVFVGLMVVYYFGFVQFVQFFSKEEQEKFMKAYVLNANQMRKKSGYQGYMAAMYRRTAAVTQFLGFALTMRRTNNTGASGATNASKEKKAPALDASTVAALVGNNKVAAEPFQATSVKVNNATAARNATLRASLMNGSMKVGWSGKVLSAENESRRVFELLNPPETDAEDSVAIVAETGTALVEEFPDHFQPMLASAEPAEIADGACSCDVEEGGVALSSSSVRAAEVVA